jgi:hypothetical protein
MATEAKREAIEKYFRPYPEWAVRFIGIGIVFIIVFIIIFASDRTQLDYLVLVAGIVALVIGVIGVFSAIGKPSDEKMDEYIAEDLSHAKIKSLRKASIDESELIGESVVVYGPRFWSTGGSGIGYKRGDDGRLRFTPIEISVLHMTEHQLICYRACLDLFTGNFLKESTDEYFYKDVVSVATRTETESRTFECDDKELGKIELKEMEIFVLTTSGGTSFKIILKDPQLIKLMGGGDIPTAEAERAIQVVRKMLREKKRN